MLDTIRYREATVLDIPEIAKLCSHQGEDETYWKGRIHGYITLEFNPHQATSARLVYVAVHKGIIIGFIAGHLTKRTDYPGQIQWITTAEQVRRTGVGSELLWILAGWFMDNQVKSVRVDIDPKQTGSMGFYRYHHAMSINTYWQYWDDIQVVLSDHEPSSFPNGLIDF